MNVFVINGHPDNNSFCHALAENYKLGADRAGNVCHLIHPPNLKSTPNLKYGYNIQMELEPDLAELQKLITEANHLVFIYPTWWGTYPVLFKGFIDRLFLTGYAFKYQKCSPIAISLMKGKTARIITTMDTPVGYYSIIYH